MTGEAPARSTLLLVYHLGTPQAAAVRRALERGGQVACVSIDPEAASRLEGDVRVLPPGALPAFEEAAQVEGSFDLTELAVGRLLGRRPALGRRLARLAGSDDELYRYLCRSLLRDVGGLFALLQLVAAQASRAGGRVVVDRHWPNGADLAFLAGLAGGLDLPPELADALERTVFEATASPVALRLRTALRALRQAADLWAEWVRRIRVGVRRPPKRPLLIRTYATDWGLDRGGQRRLRNLDFVVDGETIRADEVAILAEENVPGERDADLEARGYAVLRRSRTTVGPARFAAGVLPRLVSATASLLRLAAVEPWWRQPVGVLLSEALLWREIARTVRPRAMLVVNDIHPSGAARTLALRSHGCRTVIYEYASSWAFDARGWVPDFVYGFTIADALVTWGPLHTEIFRQHRGAIGAYWEVGCLWSEHARLIRDEPSYGDPYREELERAYGISPGQFAHVIGVFDTSLAPLLLRPPDLVAFYAGVAALARRLPRVLFLCKPKRQLDAVLAGVEGWSGTESALGAAPNVVVLDSHFETAAAIGLSDLSINACYTSPAVETIGAGRAAVYYDPTDRFPDAFFRAIPDFVATSEEELARLVDRQLAASEEARAGDLRSRFEGLEGHFDGLAITRLRARLRAVLDE